MITIGSTELAGKTNREVAQALLDNATEFNPDIDLTSLVNHRRDRKPYSVAGELLFGDPANHNNAGVQRCLDWVAKNAQVAYDVSINYEWATRNTMIRAVMDTQYSTENTENLGIHWALGTMFLIAIAAEFKAMYEEMV